MLPPNMLIKSVCMETDSCNVWELLGLYQSAVLPKRLLRCDADFFQFSECIVHKLIDLSFSCQCPEIARSGSRLRALDFT
jgi:hypothetical protein